MDVLSVIGSIFSILSFAVTLFVAAKIIKIDKSVNP